MFSDHQSWKRGTGRNIVRAVLLLLLVAHPDPVPVHAQPAEQPPPAAGDQPADNQPAAPSSPLLTEPTSAGALFDAVVLMTDLGRPNLANGYLRKLLEMTPDDATLLAMRDKHGPAVFLRLSNLVSLQPGSVVLLEKMNAAFGRFAADTTRIDRLIGELQGAPSVRDAAILQLRSGGALVVPRLVERIGDVKDDMTRELLIYTLAMLGSEVIPPVLAVLESDDDNLKTAALEVLGRIGTRDVAVHLWFFSVDAAQPPGVRVSAAEAVARLTMGGARHASSLGRSMALRSMEQGARLRLAGGRQDTAGPKGKVRTWYFDKTAGGIRSTSADATDAALHVGTRLAQQALAISPENRRLQALVVSLVLARARHRTPWTQALPRGRGTAYDAALLAGRDVVMQSLSESLGSGNATAAVAALEVLRNLASRHDLQPRGAGLSPLVGAMNYPDPRVQFTAAMAVVETDPQRSFRGASRVVGILSRALNSTDSRRAVVAGPKPDRVNALAGLVDQNGFRSVIVSSGRDAFKEAAGRGNVQLVILDANVIRWSLSETMANLRADARTAWMPVLIVGEPMRISSVERMISRDPLLGYMQRPANVKGFGDQVRPFLAKMTSEPLSAAERGDRSRAAVDLLGFLAEGQRATVFDLRAAEANLHVAIQVPELASGAVYALAAIGTVSSQDRLATTAMQPNLSASTRERAAAHLAFHMQKHGVLLTKNRIEQLRTHHSEETEPEVKSALAVVLGTLNPTAAQVGQRLRAFPLPTPK